MGKHVMTIAGLAYHYDTKINSGVITLRGETPQEQDWKVLFGKELLSDDALLYQEYLFDVHRVMRLVTRDAYALARETTALWEEFVLGNMIGLPPSGNLQYCVSSGMSIASSFAQKRLVEGDFEVSLITDDMRKVISDQHIRVGLFETFSYLDRMYVYDSIDNKGFSKRRDTHVSNQRILSLSDSIELVGTKNSSRFFLRSNNNCWLSEEMPTSLLEVCSTRTTRDSITFLDFLLQLFIISKPKVFKEVIDNSETSKAYLKEFIKSTGLGENITELFKEFNTLREIYVSMTTDGSYSLLKHKNAITRVPSKHKRYFQYTMFTRMISELGPVTSYGDTLSSSKVFNVNAEEECFTETQIFALPKLPIGQRANIMTAIASLLACIEITTPIQDRNALLGDTGLLTDYIVGIPSESIHKEYLLTLLTTGSSFADLLLSNRELKREDMAKGDYTLLCDENLMTGFGFIAEPHLGVIMTVNGEIVVSIGYEEGESTGDLLDDLTVLASLLEKLKWYILY